MNNPNNTSYTILFIDFFQNEITNDEIKKKYSDVKEKVNSSKKTHLETVNRLSDALENLNDESKIDINAILIWVDYKEPWQWAEIAYKLDAKAPNIKKIFIFNEEKNNYSTEVLNFGAESFAYEFNVDVLYDYIIAACEETERERFLNQYKMKLNEFQKEYEPQIISDTIENLCKSIVDVNEIGKYIEWTRATIQLFIDSNKVDTDDMVKTRSILRHYVKVEENDEIKRIESVDTQLLNPIKDDQLMQKVLKEPVPNAIRNVQNIDDEMPLAKIWRKYDGIKDEKISSWLGIPLVHGNENIGVLIFTHEKPNKYEKFNNVFLQRYAQITQAAIDNFFQIRNRYYEREVSKTLNETSNLQTLIKGILKLVNEALQSETSTYFQINDLLTQKRLFTKISQYPATDDPNLNSEKYIEIKGIAGTVFNQNQDRRIVINASEEKDFVPSDILTKDKEISMIVIPVKVGQRIIGVLTTHQSNKLDAYHRYDVLLLESIALQASAVIERTYALEMILNNTNRINILLTESLQPERSTYQNKVSYIKNFNLSEKEVEEENSIEALETEVMKSIIENAMRLTNANNAYLEIKEASSNDEQTVYVRSFGTNEHTMGFEIYDPEKDERYNPFKSQIHYKVLNKLRNNVSEKLGDLQPHTKSISSMIIEEVLHTNIEKSKGVFAAILFNDQQRYGVIYLYCETKYSLNETEKFGLQIIANQATTTIKTSRVIENERALKRANQGILKATKAIVAQTDLTEMFFSIVEQAQRIVDAELSFLAQVEAINEDEHSITFSAALPAHHLIRLEKGIGKFNTKSGNAKDPYKNRFGITG